MLPAGDQEEVELQFHLILVTSTIINKLFLLHLVGCLYYCKNSECWTKIRLWRIYVASNYKTYYGLHLQCPILLDVRF